MYFIVTNVEHSVPSRLGESSSLDMYVGATVGELGCWVDTTVTRMVQTGIEHSRVPTMAQYLGTGTTIAYRLALASLTKGASSCFATAIRCYSRSRHVIWQATGTVNGGPQPTRC